ncbi:hypothetical protein M419DRAFT_123394 [Trichoderma reesei RUT C-30]|jgi:hypothetical protein|uniref:Uncharacterized protein n=1 Tax=Hypocrea jecorina (strain ATCC 56765 / BCRC 32924 / NRRL 11460 / Rut C-30) TaxID=1344414 RepID=A0A024SC66_HYPJR|nr:hypothetical protein M419DRAFT_123394 [Trichoderma reesei RUT C-30]
MIRAKKREDLGIIDEGKYVYPPILLLTQEGPPIPSSSPLSPSSSFRHSENTR